MAFGGVELPTIRQRLVVDDSQLGGLGSRFGKVGKALGTAVAAGAAVAAAGVAAFVAKGVKGAVNVEQGLREVVTLFGETGAEAEASVAGLTKQTRELSDTVGIAQEEITGGLYQAISAGVPRDNAFEFMEVASKAAVAGVTDVETSVDGLTSIINAFGLDADEAQSVADSMFQTVKDGKTNFEELSSSIFQVAPSAASAGLSFQEVNAAVATLTAAGTPTAQATTRIRGAIDELAKPGTKVADTFERLAGQSFREFIAAGGDMQGALAILQDEAEATGAKVGDYFGSVEAAGAANQLADDQADKFAETLDNQANAAGSVQDGFETMQESTARQWDMFVTKATNVAISLGSVLLPAVNTVIGLLSDMLIPVLERVGEVIGLLVDGDLAGLARMFGLTGDKAEAGSSTVMSTFEEMRAFVSKVIGQVRDTVSKIMGELQKRLGSIMESIGAIFGGALELFTVLWDLFGDDILTFVVGAFRAIMRIIDGALKVIRGIFDVVLGLLTGDWGRAWAGIKGILAGAWDVIMGIVQFAIARVRGIIGAGFDLIRTIIGNVLGGIGRAIASAWRGYVDKIRGEVSAVRGAVSDGFSAALEFVRGIPGRILSALGNLGNMLRDAGRQIIAGLVRGITDKIQAVKDAAGRVADTVKRFIPGSPVDEGPLTVLNRGQAGRQIPRMIAAGMRREIGTVSKAADRVARAASVDATGAIGRMQDAARTRQPAGVGGRGGDSVSVSVTTHSPDDVARQVDDVLGWRSFTNSKG